MAELELIGRVERRKEAKVQGVKFIQVVTNGTIHRHCINPLRVRNIVVHNVSPIYFLYSISTGDQDRSLLSKVVNFNRKNTYVRTLCLLGIIVCITSNQFHVRTLATNYTGSTSNEEHDFHENFLRSTSVRTMWRWCH